MKLLDPFRELPEGYYRLFWAGWLLVPALWSLLLYLLISICGSNSLNGGGYKSWDALEASVTWFFVVLIAYYPIARISVWVWLGFQNDKGQTAKEGNELITEAKQIEQRQTTPTVSVKGLTKALRRSIIIFVMGGLFSIILFVGLQKVIVYGRSSTETLGASIIPVDTLPKREDTKPISSDTTSNGLPILNRDPSDPFARYGGYAISKVGNRDSTLDYQKVLLLCNKAIRLNPRDGKAFNLRATSKYNLRDFKGALED